MVGRDSFGFGLEIRYQAVTQGPERNRFNVIEADVESAIDHRANFSGQNKSLAAPRAAAEAKVLRRNGCGGFGFRMSSQNQSHGIILYMRGNRHFSNQAHQFDE